MWAGLVLTIRFRGELVTNRPSVPIHDMPDHDMPGDDVPDHDMPGHHIQGEDGVMAESAPTPAIAALLRAGVAHTLLPYEHDRRNTGYGDEVVAALGRDPGQVFKTLVAAVDGSLVVGVVPVSRSLDLKALAAAVGGKKATMAPVADAERSSGYVAGGISPLGQRRRLPTVVDVSAEGLHTICVSAGRRGLQVELAPGDLVRVAGARLAPIAV